MAVTNSDPVSEAIDAAEAGEIDLSTPGEIEPPTVPPPPSDDDEPASLAEPRVAFAGTVDDDEEGEEEPEPEPEPEPEAEPEPEPAPGVGEGEPTGPPPDGSPSLSLDEAWQSRYGDAPDVETAATLLALHKDLSSATPDRAARARAILAGYDDPVQPQPEPQPQPAAQDGPPEFAEIPVPEYADEDTKASIAAVNAQLRAQHDWMARQYEAQSQQTFEAQRAEEQRRQSQEWEAQVAASQKARDQFMTDHQGLSQSDLAAVLAEAGTRTDLYQSLVRQHQDYERAAYDTLRYVLADLPSISEKLLAAQRASESERHRAETKRKNKASAVSGAGSAAPKKSAPKNARDRDAQLLEEIRNGAL